MIQGLRTVIYQVADMDKAKAWFTQILQKPPYFDEPFYAGYNVDGFELGLQPIEESKNHNGNNTVAYWGIENARATYEELLQKGCTIHEPIMDVGGGILIGSVKDPLENIFGIIENPHFKYQPNT